MDLSALVCATYCGKAPESPVILKKRQHLSKDVSQVPCKYRAVDEMYVK